MTTAALVLALAALGHPARTAADLVRARILAATIIRSAEANDLDPVLLAAQAQRESSFNPAAVGKRGERGVLQLLPGGAALAHHRHLTPDAFAQTPINVSLASAYLARMRDLCTAKGKPGPAVYLTAYNGGGCRAGRYGREIVAAAARARAAIAAQERGHASGVCTAPSRAQMATTQGENR